MRGTQLFGLQAIQTASAAYYSACELVQGKYETLLEALEPMRSDAAKSLDSIPEKSSKA